MKTTLRILALTLAALTLVLCFAACGNKGSASNLDFKSGDVTVTVGADSAPVIEKLGSWVSMNSSDSCGGFQGKDYIYTYHGFRVSTTPAEGGQIICKVELTDDSVKTPEGLYIGMSRTAAEVVMKGYNAVSMGGNLSYTTETVTLNVTFRDDCVSGIVYVAK